MSIVLLISSSARLVAGIKRDRMVDTILDPEGHGPVRTIDRRGRGIDEMTDAAMARGDFEDVEVAGEI